MQSYQGYTDNGKIIPLGNTVIPDGCRAVVTILDEPLLTESRLERQKKALRAFERGLAECNEPLSPEFDEILNKRVNFSRRLNL
ncbi:MAG: hypothetical protein LBR82_07950 [Desulfovibrio sp.]|jgi:hypothetical protein|nr:hypothetical protein [Desulfovibrio sp.]